MDGELLDDVPLAMATHQQLDGALAHNDFMVQAYILALSFAGPHILRFFLW